MDSLERTSESQEVSKGTMQHTTMFSTAMKKQKQENTFAPGFLSGIWSHSIIGYCAALVFQLITVIGLLALIHIYPAFRFPEGPLILVILLVSLGWGTGPGIVAMLVGAGLLLYFALPPLNSLRVTQPEDVFGLSVYVIVGLIIGILASNTERSRRTSEQLRLQLNTIIEAIPDSLVLYDLQGRQIQQNRVARELISEEIPAIPLAEMPDKLVLRSPGGTLLPLEALPLARALHGETVIDSEMIYRIPVMQRDCLVSVSAAPLFAPSGKNIVGAVTITHDLSERKRTEEQEHILAEVSKVLASTLDYQETLANIARVVVPQLADWFTVDLVDAQGNFELVEVGHKDPEQVQWARALREKYPVDPASPNGAPHVARTGESELYHEITDEMLAASIKNEEELSIARQLGMTSAMNVPLIARGRTIGVVAFASTESGRKYDERDLALAEEVGRRAGVALDNARLFRDVQQARNQLEIILQGVADGIIVYNASNHIIYANEAAAKMIGYPSVQAMLDMPSPEIVSRFTMINEQGQPFPHSQLPHRRVLAGERDAQAIIGYCNAGAGQPERWSLARSRPVLDEEGEVAMVISITHDITERMHAERRKDEFISMTSHELKTPVTSLKGYTNVLQRRLVKQGDEQGLQYLARIDAQLNKLTKLINDLLDISKMQAGKLALEIGSFELDALVRETVENVQAATSTHQILIEGSVEGRVLGDKDRLEQVFVNLLSNAIKYSPQAEKVIVHLSQEQEQAIISVQDFGIGIAEAHYQRIFERFYQVTDPEEKTFPGLGIGLYISSEIIERHHGRIWVESDKGQGSTFSIALPLTQEAS